MTDNSNAGGTSGPGPRAQPESLRGRSLEISLTAHDLQKSLAWYCDVVGFTIDRQHERDGKVIAASLKAGAIRILITQDDGKRGADRTKAKASRSRSLRRRTSTTLRT